MKCWRDNRLTLALLLAFALTLSGIVVARQGSAFGRSDALAICEAAL